MENILLILATITIIAAALTFYRFVKGPTVFDRIVAVDAMGIMFLIVLILVGLYYQREIFIDVALIFGLLMFIDVLVMAKYFSQKNRENQESRG